MVIMMKIKKFQVKINTVSRISPLIKTFQKLSKNILTLASSFVVNLP
jgi:hypothetical protein